MRISQAEINRTHTAFQRCYGEEMQATFCQMNAHFAQVLQRGGVITSDDLNRYDREYPAGTIRPEAFDWNEVNESLQNGLGSTPPTAQAYWDLAHP